MADTAKKCCAHEEQKPSGISALREHPPFDALRQKTVEELGRASSVQNVAKGHVVLMHEDEASFFYFIESGWVKIYRETIDGDEAVLDVLPAGEIFGETAVFEGGAYSYSAEAVDDARLIAFPLAVLEREARENSAFAMALLRHLSSRGLQKDKEIELRSVQNAPQRIGCFLLRLIKGNEANAAIIHLAWEKSMIAARLGMTPETFSRSLARLQNDVGIKIKGHTIEIPDIGALVRYTCTACSNVFPCDN